MNKRERERAFMQSLPPPTAAEAAEAAEMVALLNGMLADDTLTDRERAHLENSRNALDLNHPDHGVTDSQLEAFVARVKRDARAAKEAKRDARAAKKAARRPVQQGRVLDWHRATPEYAEILRLGRDRKRLQRSKTPLTPEQRAKLTELNSEYSRARRALGLLNDSRRPDPFPYLESFRRGMPPGFTIEGARVAAIGEIDGKRTVPLYRIRDARGNLFNIPAWDDGENDPVTDWQIDEWLEAGAPVGGKLSRPRGTWLDENDVSEDYKAMIRSGGSFADDAEPEDDAA